MKSRSVILFLLLVMSCSQEKSFHPVDLSSYGIPLGILAPDSIRVVKKEYDMVNDFLISFPPGMEIQVFETDTSHHDPEVIKYEMLGMILEEPSFREIVSEDSNGFIYKRKLTGMEPDYDFRLVRLAGGKQYVFQASLSRSYDLDEITMLYTLTKGQ